LIVANSHASKKQFELDRKIEWAEEKHGLIHGKDILFTSTMLDNEPLPRDSVADLFKVSNLFVFASEREVCPNVLLEAKISSCLLAVSESLSCGYEFGGEKSIQFKGAPARIPGIPDNDIDNYCQNDTVDYEALAKMILEHLPSLKHKWEFSYDNIWKQMQPLLTGAGGSQ
jgi:hypothetical protein